MQDRKRVTDVQNRLLDSVGEGEGGMFWENIIKKSMKSREGVEKRESSYTVGGDANWYSHYGEQYGDSLKN